MSLRPRTLEYARGPSKDGGGTILPARSRPWTWAFLAIHSIALVASVALAAQIYNSRGWDRFALVVLEWCVVTLDVVLLIVTAIVMYRIKQASRVLRIAIAVAILAICVGVIAAVAA